MVKKHVIALESRLSACRNVLTLGVRPDISRYSPEELKMIRKADKIYYPSVFFADLFDSMGIATFPSYHTYKCVQDKIRQTALFDLLAISHPRTRVFYGKRQKGKITEHFSYPFVAKIPRGSAMGRGVFLIRDKADLDRYDRLTSTAYVQDYLPIDRDIRVVVIGDRAVHAYWRISPPDDFRSNVAVGATISLEDIPAEAVDFALETARRCRWDDVGIDVCRYDGRYYALEANMKYGKEGFRAAGIDYIGMMEKMIENGEI